MLTAVDAKTGEKMTDDSIVDNVRPSLVKPLPFSSPEPQLLTFLIAGHETTSGVFSRLHIEFYP
jgi:hypothetical protein